MQPSHTGSAVRWQRADDCRLTNALQLSGRVAKLAKGFKVQSFPPTVNIRGEKISMWLKVIASVLVNNVRMLQRK